MRGAEISIQQPVLATSSRIGNAAAPPISQPATFRLAMLDFNTDTAPAKVAIVKPR